MANLLSSPEDFNTTWTTFNSAVTVDTTVAPDGTTTADTITDDNGGGGDELVICGQALAGITSDQQYTYSCFCKKDQLDFALLRVGGFDGFSNSIAWFDLSSGTVGTVEAGFDSAGITAYAKGFYRCEVQFTPSGSDMTGFCQVGPAENDGSENQPLDGTSSIIAWGGYANEGGEPETYVSEAGITVKPIGLQFVRGLPRDLQRDLVSNLVK